MPCLALRAAGLFVLARRERRGCADTGAPERGETRGKAPRAAVLCHAFSSPPPFPPVSTPKDAPRAGRKAPIVSRLVLHADTLPKGARIQESVRRDVWRHAPKPQLRAGLSVWVLTSPSRRGVERDSCCSSFCPCQCAGWQHRASPHFTRHRPFCSVSRLQGSTGSEAPLRLRGLVESVLWPRGLKSSFLFFVSKKEALNASGPVPLPSALPV